MKPMFFLCSCVLLIALAERVYRAKKLRSAMAPTTLLTAWRWMMVTLTAWLLLGVLTQVLALYVPSVSLLENGTQHQLWYLLAVLSLCAPMAVLGARRPASRVWAVFVLLPMLIVLAWPAIVAWGTGQHADDFRLETPQRIGFVLVLVMGVGNYFGSRFTLACLLYAGALLAILHSLSHEDTIWDLQGAYAVRVVGLLLLVASLYRIGHVARSLKDRRPTADPETLTRYRPLWLDFCDWFGIVWGKRLMDRLNQTAVREAWPIRIDLTGPVWHLEDEPERPLTDDEHARIEHHFRWLLRRFVDPEWIDARLPSRHPLGNSPEEPPLPDP